MGVREGRTSWFGEYVLGWGLRRRLGGTLRRTRGTAQKSYFGHFGKLLPIGRPWMNVLVRVFQKVAKIRVIIFKI